MSRLDFAAERRSAQDHSSTTKLDAIGEIRMTAGKLRDARMFCLTGKMRTQKRLKLTDVELLPGPDGSVSVAEVGHFGLYSHLPVSEQGFIVQMRKYVKGAERKPTGRKYEFAERTVSRHPGDTHSAFERKMPSAPERTTDGA